MLSSLPLEQTTGEVELLEPPLQPIEGVQELDCVLHVGSVVLVHLSHLSLCSQNREVDLDQLAVEPELDLVDGHHQEDRVASTPQ